MHKDQIDKNIIPSSENYILDYPNKNDLADFLDYVKHEDAMAEIYFENDLEKLDEETIQLFNNNGKLRHNTNRCDLMLVLRDNEKVIGFIELKLAKSSEVMSQLFSLFVSEKYRRKGLGNLMMVYALDFFANSGQTNMTVSPTAESLAVYNKFGFYPPEFDDSDSLREWFKRVDKERLEQLQDEPSEFLMMDLKDKFCRETFMSHCKIAFQHFVTFAISQDLTKDLNLKINVLDWRKKAVTPTLLSNSDMGVLTTLNETKKRKAESEENVLESEQTSAKKSSIDS